MELTDFLCLITENIIAIPVIDANIPQKQKQFILFCFYVITKERLDIEFIAQNCSINQKRTIICLSMFFHCLTKQGLFGDTHVQVIYAFRQRCVSAFLFSIRLLSSHSNKPITMVHPTTKVTIVMQKIHWQRCPVCSLCSILLLILMFLLHFDMI